MKVPDRKQQLNPDDVRVAFVHAFAQEFGFLPTENQTALMMGHSALETLHWRAIHNNNVGNLKPGSRWNGDTVEFRCSEILNGVEVFFDPPHPQCVFRAYPSLGEGARDYLRLITRNDGWKAGLLSGDPEVYNRALSKDQDKGKGYYTASPSKYLTTLKSTFKRYGGKAVALPGSSLPLPVEPSPFLPTDAILKRGSYGVLVGVWQRIVNQSFDPSQRVAVTGIFDDPTLKLTLKWQKMNGLKVDGIVGRKSWGKVLN